MFAEQPREVIFIKSQNISKSKKTCHGKKREKTTRNNVNDTYQTAKATAGNMDNWTNVENVKLMDF